MSQMRLDNEAQINPQMVTLARQSRGITQQELSKSTGFSQGKLSKIEAGLLGASLDDLTKLSYALGYPDHFFTQDFDTFGVSISEVYHRKRQKASVKSVNLAYAESEIRRLHVTKLLRSVDIGENNFPYYDVDEFEGRVDEIADSVRSAWQIPDGPIKNIIATIENSGGLVSMCHFGTVYIDGFSRRSPNLPPMFFLNQDMPPDRLRWTACHEMGHIIMHKMPHPDMESEANRFASEFLMPTREIKGQLRDLTLEKLASLKQYWRVSMQSLVYRAVELGMQTERQKRSWFTKFNRLGYLKREPIELDPPKESPQLLGDILNVHRQIGYTDAEIRDLIAVGENDWHIRYKYDGGPPQLRLIK